MKPNLLHKKITLVCTSLLLLMHAAAQTKDQLNVKLSSPGKAFLLIIRLPAGAVQVTPHEGSDLQIEAAPQIEKPPGIQNQNRNQNNNSNSNNNTNVGEPVPSVKEAATGKYIKATESGNTVVIAPLNAMQKLDMVVRVPKTKAIFRVQSMIHCDIIMQDLTGEIDISGNAGEITLRNISGSAVVSNVAGGITASFKAVTENTAMAFTTLTGNIDISVPPDFKANVKVNSDNGVLFSDFEMNFGSGPVRLKVNRTTGGQYRIETANGITGRVGGGGADIRIKNMDGNIYLRKNK